LPSWRPPRRNCSRVIRRSRPATGAMQILAACRRERPGWCPRAAAAGLPARSSPLVGENVRLVPTRGRCRLVCKILAACRRERQVGAPRAAAAGLPARSSPLVGESVRLVPHARPLPACLQDPRRLSARASGWCPTRGRCGLPARSSPLVGESVRLVPHARAAAGLPARSSPLVGESVRLVPHARPLPACLQDPRRLSARVSGWCPRAAAAGLPARSSPLVGESVRLVPHARPLRLACKILAACRRERQVGVLRAAELAIGTRSSTTSQDRRLPPRKVCRGAGATGAGIHAEVSCPPRRSMPLVFRR